MYIIYGLTAAFSASFATILMKISLTKTSSSLITAIKTIIIFIFSIIGLFFIKEINVGFKEISVILLSGVTTSLSWIFYYEAVKLTNIKNIVAIDKISTVITMILAFIFLNEPFNFISFFLISLGIFIMIEKKIDKYLFYGILSIIFLSITAILSKVGIENTSILFTTFLRTLVILIMTWILVLIKKQYKEIKYLDKKTLALTFFSAIATIVSWTTFYLAIKVSEVSKVLPLEKLNIIFTTIFSYYILKEEIKKKEILGIALIVIGTIYLVT